MVGQPSWAICVPTGRKEWIVEVLLEKVTRVKDLVTFNFGIGKIFVEGWTTFAGMGRLPDVGKVPLVPVGVGKGKGLPVPIGNGGGRRPDADVLKLVVKLTVGIGSKPELGAVGFMVKLESGVGRAETELKEYAEALRLGKIPEAIEKIGKAEMFNVGNGGKEAEAFGRSVGSGPPTIDTVIVTVVVP